MGLDIVELVMEVEEEFDVRIPDREAERLMTVGDLYRWLLRQLGRQAAGPCLSGVTFYRVRRAFMAIGFPRFVVAPRTGLRELLPEENRRELWGRLGQALRPLRLPALRRPYWLFVVAAAVSLVTLGAGAFATYGQPGEALWCGGLVLGILSLAGLAYRLSAPLAVCFPQGSATVGDMVRSVLERNREALCAEVLPAEGAVRPGKEREVWDTLCRVIGENMGIDPNRLTESTRWLEDLGAD